MIATLQNIAALFTVVGFCFLALMIPLAIVSAVFDALSECVDPGRREYRRLRAEEIRLYDDLHDPFRSKHPHDHAARGRERERALDKAEAGLSWAERTDRCHKSITQIRTAA